MSIKKGSTAIVDRYKGSTLIGKVYKGSTEIFNAYSEVSGSLPLVYESRVEHILKNYVLYGSASGAGVQTENLWDENYENITNYPTYKSINVGDGSFTLSTNVPLAEGAASLFLMPGQQSSGATTKNNGVFNGRPRTVTSVDGYITLVYRIYGGANPRNYRTTLTEGSTAPDHYIPYGYSIPLTITSGAQSQDYPLYIGSTKLGAEEYLDYGEQKVCRWADITGLSEPLCDIDTAVDSLDLSTGKLTRRIKKLVLTGGSEDGVTNITTQGIIYITPLSKLKNVGSAFCTHFKNVIQTQGINMPDNSFTTRGGAGTSLWFKTDYTTVADFRSYLAAQNATGTPVTVWYVLDEPETSTIPVPTGLTGTIDGYLIQDGAPTPENPIYPTANGVKQMDGTYSINSAYLQPTDPPVPFPAITAYKGENTLSSTETVGEVSITGRIKETET